MDSARPVRGLPRHTRHGASFCAIAAALVLLFAVPAFLAGCGRGPARTVGDKGRKVIVAVTPWPASAPIYVAHEKGYFRDEGIDAALHSYPSGHLGLGAVLAGQADFATATETPIARAVVEGKPLAVIATVAEIQRAIQIIARKDRGIGAPDDLAGKRVGVTAGSAGEFFLDIYLTTSHIDPKTVRTVDLAPDKLVGALLSGDVDAACTWAPHTTVLQERLGRNGTVLDEPGLYTMTWNLVAARELTRRDPDVVARFLRAIVRANRLIDDQPAEARAMTAKAGGMDIRAVEREWGRCDFATHLDQTLLMNLEDQAHWMIRKQSRRGGKGPGFLDYVYTNGLATANAGAVRIVSH